DLIERTEPVSAIVEPVAQPFLAGLAVADDTRVVDISDLACARRHGDRRNCAQRNNQAHENAAASLGSRKRSRNGISHSASSQFVQPHGCLLTRHSLESIWLNGKAAGQRLAEPE